MGNPSEYVLRRVDPPGALVLGDARSAAAEETSAKKSQMINMLIHRRLFTVILAILIVFIHVNSTTPR